VPKCGGVIPIAPGRHEEVLQSISIHISFWPLLRSFARLTDHPDLSRSLYEESVARSVFDLEGKALNQLVGKE